MLQHGIRGMRHGFAHNRNHMDQNPIEWQGYRSMPGKNHAQKFSEKNGKQTGTRKMGTQKLKVAGGNRMRAFDIPEW